MLFSFIIIVFIISSRGEGRGMTDRREGDGMASRERWEGKRQTGLTGEESPGKEKIGEMRERGRGAPC